MTYSSPFNIPDRNEEQLAMEDNWERLRREAEIRRVMELFTVVGEWRKGWERPNRRKWRGCLWKHESHFRVIMGALEKRRSSVKWKATWQALNSGLGGNRSGNTEGNAGRQFVLGVGERSCMSRREARRTVIELSSDSERDEKLDNESDDRKNLRKIQKGQSSGVKRREERDGKERSSDWKGKAVMVEDTAEEGEADEVAVVEKEKTWIKVVSKPRAMGRQVLQIPSDVITGCELEGKTAIGLYDTDQCKGYIRVLKKRDNMNEMFLCRGWYEYGKSRIFKKGDILHFTIRYPPVEEILVCVVRGNE